jgi:hypothetical protein
VEYHDLDSLTDARELIHRGIDAGAVYSDASKVVYRGHEIGRSLTGAARNLENKYRKLWEALNTEVGD